MDDGRRSFVAEATAEGLWLQVGALLLELGVLSGERRLLVLGDGASWIRTWFEGLGIAPKAMIVCWWPLRKRCFEQLSAAGGDLKLYWSEVDNHVYLTGPAVEVFRGEWPG